MSHRLRPERLAFILLFKRIIEQTYNHKKWLFIAGLSTILGLGLDLAAPLLLKHLIDETISNQNLSRLNVIIGIFALIYVIKFFADLASGGSKARFNENVVRDLRQRLYDHLQTLSLPFFYANRSGYLTSRLFSDTSLLSGMLGDTLLGIASNLLLLAGAVTITFYLNWRLTLVLLLIAPALAFAAKWFSARIRSVTSAMQEQVSQLCGNVQENLAGIALIQADTMEALSSERVGRDLRELRRLNVQLADLTTLHRAGTLVTTSLAGLAILWFGSRQLAIGALTLGDLMAFLAYAVNVYRPVQALLGINISMQQSAEAARRVFELLDASPSVQERPKAITLRSPLRGKVRYIDVSFAYEKQDALSNISFDVEPGMRVAVVGRSGAGKTTLLNLLPRFYDVKQGRIEIDDLDIREISLKSLRGQIGIVAQETFLFAGTIRENLLCSRPNAPSNAVKQAIELAQLDQFIANLPAGLDTHIGERGFRISGGERQRLAIARSLLKDPPIMILDEATSSVDAISESLIKQALRHLLAKRTCFTIAHRFTTILDADLIIVLDAGRIVGLGRHDELYAANGVYARLYDEQFAAPAGYKHKEDSYLLEDGALRGRIMVRTDASGFRQVTVSRLPS